MTAIDEDHAQILKIARRYLLREFERLDQASAEAGCMTATSGELTRVLEAVLKLDRLTHGQSTEAVAVQEAQDLSRLTTEELAEYLRLTVKATPGYGF